MGGISVSLVAAVRDVIINNNCVIALGGIITHALVLPGRMQDRRIARVVIVAVVKPQGLQEQEDVLLLLFQITKEEWISREEEAGVEVLEGGIIMVLVVVVICEIL